MKLIIILVSLALERYLHVGDMFKRFKWFPAYANLLKSVLKAEVLWGKWQGLAVLMAPVLAVVILISIILYAVHAGLGELLFGILILFYCFGPIDFYQAAQNYLSEKEDSASKNKDKETTGEVKADEVIADLIGSEVKQPVTDIAVTERVFQQAYQRIFAVIFWFLVLGPLGAVLYRLTTVIREMSASSDSAFHDLYDSSNTLQQVLDWIPIRINALVYVLVGNFNAGFSAWLKNISGGLSSNETLLNACGSAALGVDAKSKDGAMVKAALSLIDRGFIVLLVLIAVFELGSWLY